MPTQREDIEFGTGKEIPVLEKLQTFLQTELGHQGTYAVFDYANPTKTIYVELKSRRIRHDTYPTALVGLNKVMFCSDPNKEYYFCWCYTDGLFYLKYDKALFDTFERNYEYRRGERDDCINTEQSIVYVPREHLKRWN